MICQGSSPVFSDRGADRAVLGLQLRGGEEKDSDWLFEVYRHSMQPYVHAAWGWDEDSQREGFEKHLSASSWIIVRYKNRDLGGYVLKNRDGYFWLEMLVVLQRYRKSGIGSRIIEHIQSIADPLKLSVFKGNPALSFYRKHGFQQYDQDEHSFKLEWKNR